MMKDSGIKIPKMFLIWKFICVGLFLGRSVPYG